MIIKNTDEKLLDDFEYQEFLKENPGRGVLKIRTSSASETLPVSDVLVTVTKVVGKNTIVFFDGKTDDSGMINGIVLPTPKRVSNDEEVPKFATYSLRAVHLNNNFDKTYDISLCCGVVAIQYINIVPNVEMEMRMNNGY